ncbi:hypothetical protein LIS04_189 [Listeria phage LIS04]|nr:hypothetical protein LIS04_189 [Listeria phage LIS04]
MIADVVRDMIVKSLDPYGHTRMLIRATRQFSVEIYNSIIIHIKDNDHLDFDLLDSTEPPEDTNPGQVIHRYGKYNSLQKEFSEYRGKKVIVHIDYLEPQFKYMLKDLLTREISHDTSIQKFLIGLESATKNMVHPEEVERLRTYINKNIFNLDTSNDRYEEGFKDGKEEGYGEGLGDAQQDRGTNPDSLVTEKLLLEHDTSDLIRRKLISNINSQIYGEVLEGEEYLILRYVDPSRSTVELVKSLLDEAGYSYQVRPHDYKPTEGVVTPMNFKIRLPKKV